MREEKREYRHRLREGSRDKREGGKTRSGDVNLPHILAFSFPVEITRVEDNTWQKYQHTSGEQDEEDNGSYNGCPI